MEIWPDLFGRALLVRQWGRIGTAGRLRLDPYPDPGAAINALAACCGLSAGGATRIAPDETATSARGSDFKDDRKSHNCSARAKIPKSAVREIAPKAVAKRPAKPPAPAPQTGMQLHTADGGRKYLTAGERDAFLRQAELADRMVRTLCMTLAYAVCRLSEALALTADRVDLAAAVLVFEGLKKRRTGIFRSVPVPPALLDALDMVHGVREIQTRRGNGQKSRALAVVADDRLAGSACGDAGRWASRGAGVAQRAAARLRRRRGDRRDPAQPGAEMARSRPAQHHSGLCQRRRRRREGYCQADVALIPLGRRRRD